MASGAAFSAPAGSAGRATVGILALQGSFPLHARGLERCGVAAREVRQPRDLEGLAGLVVPGGESTVISLLARQNGLFEPIRELGRGGLPIFGTCAGAILLGRPPAPPDGPLAGPARPPRWELVEVEVLRNAYGTQVDSFSADLDVAPFDAPFRGVFIRAPRLRIPRPRPEVEVLAEHRGDPVLVRAGRFLLAAFHPELTDDLRVHRYFLECCGVLERAAAAPAGAVPGAPRAGGPEVEPELQSIGR
jgi:5'-phosphate synthase pdxT subunit